MTIALIVTFRPNESSQPASAALRVATLTDVHNKAKWRERRDYMGRRRKEEQKQFQLEMLLLLASERMTSIFVCDRKLRSAKYSRLGQLDQDS